MTALNNARRMVTNRSWFMANSYGTFEGQIAEGIKWEFLRFDYLSELFYCLFKIGQIFTLLQFLVLS
jgi:hypothetical protein